MNETRRKPTTGTQCPTLFDKCRGMFSMPSHTDTAGHTKAFIYPVTQTRLDIPRPLFTQSHRHGWTYQGLYLPSHTDTAGHTKAFIYPVMDHCGESQSAPTQGRFEPPTCRSTVEHAIHQTTMIVCHHGIR